MTIVGEDVIYTAAFRAVGVVGFGVDNNPYSRRLFNRAGEIISDRIAVYISCQQYTAKTGVCKRGIWKIRWLTLAFDKPACLQGTVYAIDLPL